MIAPTRIFTFVFITLLSACSTVHVEQNTLKPNKNFDSVHGDVFVGAYSSVAKASTVNGDISIDNNVTIKSASTVNGDIYADDSVKVLRSLITVNGDIELNSNSSVAGKIETVNGDISLHSTTVGQDIITINGDISLTGNTHVKGKVRIQNRQTSNLRIMGIKIVPEITIGPDVIIEGPLIYESNVKLNINPKAKVSRIINSSDLK